MYPNLSRVGYIDVVDDDAKTDRVNARVSKKTRARLAARAAREHRTEGDMLRILLDKALDGDEKAEKQELDADAWRAATAEVFADPRPGDLFHEMFSFRVVVLKVAPDGGPVVVVEHAGPGRLPDDGKLRRFDTADAYRATYAYQSIPGYWVILGCRDVDVTGWLDHLTREQTP